MGNETVIRLRAMHPGQERIAALLKRFNHLRMGRRWGKTSFGVDYLATNLGGKPGSLDGYPTGWFAPTNKLLYDTWEDAKSLLAPAVVRKNEDLKRLELINGGVMEFWSLEKENPARGRKYSKVVIDEAAIVRRLLSKWHKSIRPTLTDYSGGALFASTPQGRNEFRKLEDDLRTRNPHESAFLHAPTAENPYISAAEIELARLSTPSLIFRQEYLAEYVDTGGGILRPEWVQVGQPPVPLPIVLGVDLAISTKSTADWTVIVAMCREPRTGVIYIVGVWRFRAAFNDILLKIQEVADLMQPVVIGIENNQFQAAVVQEMLRQTTLNVIGIRRDKDKVTSFMPLAVRYEQGLVRHDPNLPAYYNDELMSFTGTKDDDHDDCVDASSTAYQVLPAARVSISGAGERMNLQ